MTALQQIKEKKEIVYVVKFPATEHLNDQIRRMAVKQQNAQHLAMVRKGRK